MDARTAENIKQLLSDEVIIEFLTKQVTKLRDDIGDELAKAAAENESEKIRFRLSTKFTPELLDQLSDDLKAELKKRQIPDPHQSLNDYVANHLKPQLPEGIKLEPISITSNSIIMRCTDASGQQSVARIYAEQVENKIPVNLEKYMIHDENQAETNKEPYKYFSTMALAQSDLSGAERENAHSIASQLVNMMLDFKLEGVCFYDIKPGNFLIMPNGDVKIGDKKSIYEAKRNESISGKGYVGTPQFEPPEMFNESGAIVTVDSRESYAIGLSLYLAFVDANAHKTRDEKTGEHTFDFTHPFFDSEPDGPLFKCVIQGLTQVKPENRLSMESVQYIFSIYQNEEYRKLDKNDKMKLIHALSHPNSSKRIRDEDLKGLNLNELSSLAKCENIYLELKLRKLVNSGTMNGLEKDELAKRFEKIQDRDYIDIIFNEKTKLYLLLDKQHMISDLLYYQTITSSVRYDKKLKEKIINKFVENLSLTTPESLTLPMIDVQLTRIDESKNDLIGLILQQLHVDHKIEISDASFNLLNNNWKLSQVVDKLINYSKFESGAELDALIHWPTCNRVKWTYFSTSFHQE